MAKQRKLTGDEWLTIANGVASGCSALQIAELLGEERAFVRTLFGKRTLVDDLVLAIGSPGALDADARASLFCEGRLYGEREAAAELRHDFALAVREAYPEYFEREERREARRKREEERRRREEELRYEAEDRGRRVARERAYECHKADFWNLQTLVAIHAHDWKCGTTEELARGLATEEARKTYRCAHGLRWTCAGHGPYYEPMRSAARCRMEYELQEDATGDGWIAAWDRITSKPEHAEAMRELHGDGEPGARDRKYLADPFPGRDKRLPVTVEAARALCEAVKARGVEAFAELCGVCAE